MCVWTAWALRAAISALVVMLVGLVAPLSGLASAPPEPVLGIADGLISEPGSLTPIGYGRFVMQDRVYTGRSLGRSVSDDWASCFSGTLTSTEHWTLEAPRLAGSHLSTVVIRSERSVLTLRLQGQMELLAASGSWDIVRASGACSSLVGEGRYSATFTEQELRLTFEGQVRT